MRLRRLAGSLAIGLLACAAASAAEGDANALAQKAREIFKESCHGCHHGEASAGGDFDVLRHGDLMKDWASGAALIVPKKLEGSYLWQRVGVEKSMPPRNSKLKRPGEAEIAVLRQWLEAGAPPFPDATAAHDPKFIKLPVVLTAVRDHLRKAGRDRRTYLRYFTLHHLYNSPNVTDGELRMHRAALAKALNSLSWKIKIVRPEAVDAQQTIFAVDVRDLDWDRGNLWQEIMKHYPYGLKYRNYPDRALQELSDDIEEMTGCDMPLVRSDWFVATATRPPLYHTLLRLPTHATELEKMLSVDVAANFKDPTPERIARGAVHKSGVSGQNRLVERHDAKYGSYWKSYDFLPGRARSKLTRFPLGPLNLFAAGKHPYPAQAFEHDGGELIFNLPNGLQAYLLVNGKDERIDEGPIAVVGDEQKTSGTAAIVTGVSCMACHKHGMISFKDVVRDGSSVFGQAEQLVKLLYPEKTKMDELLQEDEDRFLAALEKSIGPFLRVGDDKKKPLREFVEPVGEVARLHRLGYLDLKMVAVELDLENPEVIRTTVGETKLKRLGLDSLLRGGVIGRLDWEAIDGVSLMQELARELRYLPFSVPRD